ncbi:MAG: sugar ABC transporter ATP-binding protein [Microscillaceae bacterium]|nr:sugar ABC transporter ATP-binding protein [Microscillaceae bacterium]
MLLQLQNISKSFASIPALDRVNLDLQAGEVQAICGENGAGKSTLMNILTGNLQPDSGHIILEGKSVQFRNYQDATQQGISIVYQSFSLIETLSVAENIFINHLPQRWGLIRHTDLKAQTTRLLDKLQIKKISPNTLVSNLAQGQKQMVEIAKALSLNPKILILDEPTASITESETKVLLEIIRELKLQSVGIIYISHRLSEIFEIADRVSVLKDGNYQGTWPLSELSREQLIDRMVGRKLEPSTNQSFVQSEVVLEVKNLTGENFQQINFQLKKGEILALAGLVGSGRTEILRAIYGSIPIFSGEIFLEGKSLTIKHPQDAIQAGLAYVPEDRKRLGIFSEMTIRDNILAVRLDKATSNGLWNPSKAEEIAQEFKEKLRIISSSLAQKAITLSGGNQQKIILAKCLLQNPKVLLVDEPTHGIDIGAKFEIYKLLKKLTEEGMSIVLISSELPEIIAIADRILVIREGQIAGELNARTAQENEIVNLATH